MDVSTYKEIVKRAEKEVERLLAEMQTSTVDKRKLQHGLEEVQKDLKVLDIHAHSFEAK
jgi:hypothetical protein